MIEMAVMIYKKALVLQITLIGLLTLASSARNAVWQNDIRLWEDAVKKSPGRAGVHYNLGNVYLRKENYRKAIDQYRRALVIRPDFGEVHNNLGYAYLSLGEIDAARGHFTTALKLDPLFISREAYLVSVHKNIESANNAVKK